ncbi:hypothetical protein VPH35_017501 [Triticum aestivum]
MLIGNPRCVCPYFPKVLKPHAWGDHEMCAAVRHVAPLLQTAIISGRSHDMVCGSCFLYLLIFDFVKLT